MKINGFGLLDEPITPPATCSALPSGTSAYKLMSGDFKGGIPGVIGHTVLRSMLVGAGMAAAGERKHVVRNALGGALAIETFVLVWAGVKAYKDKQAKAPTPTTPAPALPASTVASIKMQPGEMWILNFDFHSPGTGQWSPNQDEVEAGLQAAVTQAFDKLQLIPYDADATNTKLRVIAQAKAPIELRPGTVVQLGTMWVDYMTFTGASQSPIVAPPLSFPAWKSLPSNTQPNAAAVS